MLERSSMLGRKVSGMMFGIVLFMVADIAWNIGRGMHANTIALLLDVFFLYFYFKGQRIATECMQWRALYGALYLVSQALNLKNRGVLLLGWCVVHVLMFFFVSFLLYRKDRQEIGPKKGAASPTAQIYRSIKVMVLFFVFLEALSTIYLTKAYPLLVNPPLVAKPFRYDSYVVPAGKDAILVLGSSPAYAEIKTNRPFSRILRERFGARHVVISLDRGGLDSALLVEYSGDLLDHIPGIKNIIIYAGHQDFNAADIERKKRSIMLSSDGTAMHMCAAFVFSNSNLFKALLVCVKKARARDPRFIEHSQIDGALVLEKYRTHIEQIVRHAKEHGVRVLMVTQILDADRVGGHSIAFWQKQVVVQKRIAKEHAHVDLLDFQDVIAKRTFNTTSRKELFETVPGSERGGDPYHMGPEGHRLLADMLITYYKKRGVK